MLGNGDIWEAADAVRMMAETGVAGVVVEGDADAVGQLGVELLGADLLGPVGEGGPEAGLEVVGEGG